ncbi:autotransporter domain-containing protein [Methylobacillus caricis]|uniref:autotransporter family protein n=1 Tax=Methylobacillus caricis TaxID=1971611 RepID=UPI001CFF6F62|nr:autotransporter domain-containing protein [Methylobacillus caricis]MCB5188861.1 autotransporter domain-containing protein [Methylobacillus caricis]
MKQIHTDRHQLPETKHCSAKPRLGTLLVASALASMSMMAGTQAWAAPGICGSGSTSTINSAETSQCLPDNNETVTVTSAGSITPSSGAAIDASSHTGIIINNSGLIDGNVILGGATLNLEDTSGRITGTITGTTGSAININGTFTQENAINVGGVTIASTGIFIPGNYDAGQAISGNIENNGRVVLTSDNPHGHINGDYHQTANAILEIGARGASYGEYGRLHVLGNATFDAGTGLHVNVAQVNTLANNDVLSSVVYTSGLTASTFTITDNSQLFSFEAIVNGNNIDLKTIAASSSGVLNSVRNEGFGQGVGAARVLDNFVVGGATGDMANVVTAFGKLGSDSAVSNAVAQTLPLMSASIDQVATNSMRGTNRVIQARQEGNIGRSSGEGFLGDKYFWFKPIAAKANQGNRNGVAGYNADTYGFIIGADAEVNDTNRLGVAFSYMNSNVDGKSTSRYNGADIDAYQVIAYGSHNLANDPDVEINWQADFGINKNDGRRTINFGGLNRVAKSDFDSTTAHIGAGISRSIQLSERTSFIPSARADYFWIRNESYTEKGADALNLKVGSATSEQLIAMVEGRLQHRLTDRAAFTANAGVGYDLFDEQNSISASYVGGGAAFRTQGLELSPWIGRAGLGLTVNASERTEITARYDVEGRSDFVGQTASLKVRWAF